MAQPRTFKALVCERLGQPTEPLGSSKGSLHLAQLPADAPLPPGSVRVRVLASALNFAGARCPARY